jgi:hypothetical protein
VAARRFVFQQIVQVTGAFIAQSQKGWTAHRHPDPFTSRLVLHRGRRRSNGSSTHAAEAILRIILRAALRTSHCHSCRHHYTNLDANSARPFGTPPEGRRVLQSDGNNFLCVLSGFLCVLSGNGFDFAAIVEES